MAESEDDDARAQPYACEECGDQIVFRTLAGHVAPIHVNRGACGSGPLRTLGAQREFWDDFCKPSRCPLCRAAVFFIRHNGGCVWVDELGWPWPKHGCFAAAGAPRLLDSVGGPAPHSSAPDLAIVVHASLSPSGISDLFVKRTHNRFSKIRVRADCTRLVGELIALAPTADSFTAEVPGFERVSIARWIRY